jgi:uncharacterized protein YndB with AHSA1/START domain
MPIPNTLTRVLDLAHPQEKVWAALTTLDGITRWSGSPLFAEHDSEAGDAWKCSALRS